MSSRCDDYLAYQKGTPTRPHIAILTDPSDDLKAEMIIPRSPSPVPVVPVLPLEHRPIDSLTLEEARERLRLQEQVRFDPVTEEHTRVKRERRQPTLSEDESEGGIEIVQPPKRRRVKTETIDLTND